MGQQLVFDLPLRTAVGRDDFLVADCNGDAVAWLDRWPDWPGPALCLYGPAGCGKSHLLDIWRSRSHAAGVPAGALNTATVPALAAAGAVAVDDADTPGEEAALLHLYNLLRERGGFLLLAARQPPSRWPVRLPDLRSRLNAAPAVGVEPPDDILLAALLHKLFADRQVVVNEDVVGYLVKRMERSFDAAGRLVAAVDAAALAGQQAVTIPLVRRILDRPHDDDVGSVEG